MASRRWVSAGVLGLVSCGAGATLMAQGGVSAGPARSFFLWSTTGDQTYESNVGYAPEPDVQADFISRVNSSLRVVRARARSSLELQASGSGLFYQKFPRLNLFSYDVTVGGSRRLSANTGTSGSVFYRNLLTSDARVTADPTTLLLRRAVQKSIGGFGAIGHRLTPFTTAAITGSFTSVTFSTPGLIPGAAFNGLGAVRHQFRRAGTLGMLVAVEQGSAQGIPLAAQTASAEWAMIVKKIRLQATGGVTRSANGPTARYLATGAASASDSIGPGSLSGGYSRGVSQAFGLGTLLITDAVTIAYDFQALRGNFMTFSGFLGESRVSTGGTDLESRGVALSLRRILSSGFTIGGSTSYRDRKDLVQASGYSVSIGAGYSFPTLR